MSTLIRVLHALHRQDATNSLAALVSRSVEPKTEALHGSDHAGFIAMGIIGMISFVATFGLLAFLTFRFIFWRRYYKHPLAANQYVVLIYNLLLVDIQQSIAFMLCLYWASQGRVTMPSAPCYLQGWWIQTGDPGSGLFVLAIAFHTGAVVLRGRQLPFPIFIACVTGLWLFILILGFIPVGLFGDEVFVISEAGWCWLSPDHETERLWVHYLWIFLAEFGTVVLYGVMFFYLRRRMKEAALLRHGPQENLKRLNRVVVYMVIYPLVYLLLSLPLAAGRMSTARHVAPSRTYFAVAGSLMGLSGLVDVLVYTLTRRHLLTDTEISASDKLYQISGSQAYQTHISTTGRDSTKKSKTRGRFRRGLQSINETVDDDRGDSTEDIVRKGDWEMQDMRNAVFQETTIEISHEPADPEEFHRQAQDSP